MSVTGIRALLEAAEFLNNEEIAKKKNVSENFQNTAYDKQDEPNHPLITTLKKDKLVKTSPLSHSSSSSSLEKIASSHDREAHNRLEKGRRADLKARFEYMQHLLPATKGKKCSNLSILRNATRHIQAQSRLSREYVTEIQQFSQEKSQKDKELERAWQRLSVLGVDLARVRRKVRSRHAQREKREEFCGRGAIDAVTAADQLDHEDREAAGLVAGYSSLTSPSRRLSPFNDGASSLSEDEDGDGGSESTTTASECGSNIAERAEMTDEASECGEVVVQEGTVPSQAHTSVTLSPTPLSPPSSQDSRPLNNTAPASTFQLPFASSCNAGISFGTNLATALTAPASEPLSGTSSDSGISSGANDDVYGEVKLPMKKRKLARSLVQDLSPLEGNQPSVVAEADSISQPAEKKRIISPQLNYNSSSLLKTTCARPRHEINEKQISLITTLPSYESVPALALNTTTTTSLSASMPLLQRTLTDPRPAGLVRHASFESPDSLDPNWMNQRIVPVYQLLSGANTNAPVSATTTTTTITSSPSSASSHSSSSSSVSAALPNLQSSLKPLASCYPTADKISLVTHSPVGMIKAPAVLSAQPAPSPAVAAKSVAPSAVGAAQFVLPLLGSGDNLILRNLASAGGRQPIVLMPLAASSANAPPSLVPIQLLPDNVLSTAGLVNGGLDHA